MTLWSIKIHPKIPSFPETTYQIWTFGEMILKWSFRIQGEF
jgi:hypothetical protein